MRVSSQIGALGALLLALCAISLVGASPASANRYYCAPGEPEVPPCNIGYGPHTGRYDDLSGTVREHVFSTSALTATCEDSSLEGEIVEETTGVIEGLGFTKCETCPTVKAEGLPYAMEGIPSGLKDGNGTVEVKNLKLKMTGCLGSLTCTLTAAKTILDFDGSDEIEKGKFTAPKIKASKEPLEISGLGCGKNATWSGEYQLTNPTALQLS